MLGGEGVYLGSSILISGTAGTGKTSISAYIADAACRRGERCLYFAFEESPDQLCRNLRSIGLDLAQWIDRGLLRVHAARPTLTGLEMHLGTAHREIRDFQPNMVIVDPISNLLAAGTLTEVNAMMLRLIDFLKSKQITAVFTHLNSGGSPLENTEVGVSSLIDTWILLRDIELGGERNRGLYILKSRGAPHSNQIREFLLTSKGIELRDVYVGPEGVLTGSMRLAQEARERAAERTSQVEIDRRQRELDRKRSLLEAQISVLKTEFAAQQDELTKLIEQARLAQESVQQDREAMGVSRQVDQR
jgi:circadian clock protein KaiC